MAEIVLICMSKLIDKKVTPWKDKILQWQRTHVLTTHAIV